MPLERFTTIKEYAESARSHSDYISLGELADNLPARLKQDLQNMQALYRSLCQANENDPIIVGGEQSDNFKPKHIAKQIMLKLTRAYLGEGAVSTNLRAVHDVVTSQKSHTQLWLPSERANDSNLYMQSVSVLSPKNFTTQDIMSGAKIDLYRNKIEKTLKKLVNEIDKIYTGNNLHGKNPDTDGQKVVQLFLGCYGYRYDFNTRSLVKLSQEEYSSFYKDYDLTFGRNLEDICLSDANENTAKILLNKLGIYPDITISEGVLDKSLLASGGLEIITEIYTKKIIQDPSKDSTMFSNSGGETVVRPPFNIAYQGKRLLSYYINSESGDIDYSKICIKFNESDIRTLEVAEILRDPGYDISLRAIPRVMLYSMCTGGHITGGGSVYNSTAAKLMEDLGLKYFPIAHYNGEGSIIKYASPAIAPIVKEYSKLSKKDPKDHEKRSRLQQDISLLNSRQYGVLESSSNGDYSVFFEFLQDPNLAAAILTQITTLEQGLKDGQVIGFNANIMI